MGRLQSWGAAARHSRLVQVVAAVVVIALVVGGVVLATHRSPAPSPEPHAGALDQGCGAR